MKKLLALILALVAVFCTFAGCGSTAKDNDTDNNTNVTDDTGNSGNKDDTGNGESNGDTGEQGGNVHTPIKNGGSFHFDGGNES